MTLNHDGGDLTIGCLGALDATDWPRDHLEITLVDNASRDGVVDSVRARWPAARIVRSAVNLGFAGGMNLGLTALDTIDYVALVNNDVTVSPGWLHPLVEALEADPGLGAACPKVLFATRFLEVELRVPTSAPGRGDRRALGALVSGARVHGRDVTAGTQFVDGFWGWEPARADDPRAPAQWTRECARLQVPITSDDADPTEIEVRLEAASERKASVRAGSAEVEIELGPTPRWYRIAVQAHPLDVVNSAGALLTGEWEGADRGYLQIDDGRFDDPTDVVAWSGAAVLLSARYLADVGLFDERLFLYYEDLELSVRGRERGWRYRYVPGSVVRHVHSATVGEHSRLARYQKERNRLLVLARHADAGMVPAAAGRFLLVTASYARRDVVSALLHGHRPRWTIVNDRLRAFGGFLRLLPGTVRARQRDRARR